MSDGHTVGGRRIAAGLQFPVMELTGRLHGMTITLDAPVPPLEGKRVRVVVEPVEDSEAKLTAEQQVELFKKWVDNGPQGPIADEGEPSFP